MRISDWSSDVCSSDLEAITVVGTHPHAAAQTRKWVATNLPQARVVHTNSTAAAGAGLADGTATWDAAITSPLAADHYQLQTLAQGIEANASAETRFVLVPRPAAPDSPTGPAKPSPSPYTPPPHPALPPPLPTK